MALTPNHKIYSPDIGDRAQARTQMATMASSVEAALNIQTANQAQANAKLTDLAARQAAREKLIITHTGEGLYTVTNGLGEPVAVNNDGDDNYTLIA